MRLIVVALFLMLMGLQYKLWLGGDSLPKWFQSEKKLKQYTTENQKLTIRNRVLEADVAELKTGEQSLEERARYELGMVKDDETYYHFVN
ncbi:MAG: cell division protein FtsB [Legionella sp.]|nr:cell division protein FtsB [Legionella sp.]